MQQNSLNLVKFQKIFGVILPDPHPLRALPQTPREGKGGRVGDRRKEKRKGRKGRRGGMEGKRKIFPLDKILDTPLDRMT